MMEIEGLSGWYGRHFHNRSNVISEAFREATIKQVSGAFGRRQHF
jgi:hypothetical protein